MDRARPLWLTVARRLGVIVAVVLLVAGAWLAYELRDRASLEPYSGLMLTEQAKPGGIGATFLGVSTVLFTDGETAILTDGFFTRPGRLRTIFGKIAPDAAAIDRCLARAGIRKLDAVFVVHSHFDHAMDAPEVARRTGAVVVGSESTANIARGAGLAAERIRVVAPGEAMAYGRFRVTMIRSRHFPHGMAMGEIEAPLVPPARATDYREGGSYSVLIEHGDRRLLVQGSASWVDGALGDVRADVVLLGTGLLSTRDDAYAKAYWNEVVESVHARRVIPIHWDDFTLPLDEPLRPTPRLIDDFERSMRLLTDAARASEVDVRLLPEWKAVDPFAGL
jgi:L-ascorbate metabolism protein UlaG (beta-lactamase superfamily)